MRLLYCIWFLTSFPLLLQSQEGWTPTDSLRLNRRLKGETEIVINPEAKEELERLFANPFPLKQENSSLHRFLIEDIPLPQPMQTVRRYILPPLPLNHKIQSDEMYKARDITFQYKRLNVRSQIDTFNPRVLLKRSTDIRLNTSAKISFRLYGGYSIDRSRSAILPATADPMHIGAGISYRISKNAEIQSGLERQYNLIKRQWEWVWKAGIVVRF